MVVPEGKQFYCTLDEKVLSIPSTLKIMDISPCSHEEVDMRIFLHAKDAVDKGFAKVVIKATYTDMVVIGTSLFNEIGAEEIWIEFGTSENLKYIPIHEI